MAEVVAETERLRLREWADVDEARFYAVMNRPEVMEHLGGLQTEQEFHAACERIRGFQRNFGHTFWLVEELATDELLGFCGLKRVNSPGAGELTGTHEIGWRLRPEAWGKGIAKEAAIASLDLGFGRFDAPAILALTVEDNRASWGLMERLGMQRRPELDFVDTRFGPELNPSIVYWMDAEAWPAARAAALR